MAEITLDLRMSRIAECVPNGAILADIGTDHGKLPVYLALKNKIKRAVAADINEMPLQKAVNNIKKNNLQDKIDTFLTDGLKGIEKFSPDCVAIAGMGGELIEQILEEGTIDKTQVKFILQPMTKEDSLRKYLCKNGYLITDEHIVKEGKLYQIICAEYDGKTREIGECECLLGRINIEKSEDLLGELIEKVIDRTSVKIKGKQKAKLDVSEELLCLKELTEIKENYYGFNK